MKTKKLISLMLTLAMVLTMMPTAAFAAADEADGQAVSYYVERTNPLYEGLNLEDVSAPAGSSVAPRILNKATTVEEAGDILRQGMVARQDTVPFLYPADQLSGAELEAIFLEAVKHTGVSNEGDYLNSAWLTWGCTIEGVAGEPYLKISYKMTYNTTAEQEAAVDDAVKAFLAGLTTDSMTDYEIVKSIYDYLSANIAYDYDNLEDDTYPLKYSAYAALVDQKAVCQGYASAFYRLALEFGIDTRLITGIGNGGLHAWNIVKLGDKYYNLDATWDSTYDADFENHDFFLLGTTDFVDHQRDAEFLTQEFETAYPMDTRDYVIGSTDGNNVISGTGYNGKITWRLSDNGVLTFRGEGPLCSLPEDFPKDQVKHLVVKDGITEIPFWMFCDYTTLTSVEFPDSLKVIKQGAFCRCTGLTSMKLPEGLTTIEGSAFSVCEGLKTLTFPESVEEIGDSAFSGCDGLDFVALPAGASIGRNVFASCDGLTSVEIPAGTTVIDGWFINCYSLKTVTIPDGVTTIGELAFSGCSALESVSLPDSVTTLGGQAFFGCYTLKSVTIPDSVTSIGESAFSYHPDRIFYGNPDAYIHQYAKENGFVFCCLNHKNIKKDPALPATCTTSGMTEGQVCLDCNTILLESSVVPKKPHNYGSGYTCVDCGDVNEALKPPAPVPTPTPTPGVQPGVTPTPTPDVQPTPEPEVKPAIGKVKLSLSSCVYNGKVRTPKVTVKNSDGKVLQKGKDYTVVTPKGRKAVGKYVYTVKFIGDFKGTKAKKLTLTIKPAKPVIQAPKAAKKAITVKWKKVAKETTGYQVMVATNKGFTKNTKKAFVKGSKKTFKKMTGLKAKTKYYVKVRSYKTVKGVKIYSDWSKVKNIRTK